MPKNAVSDPITDQEIAFARLILSGTMTDRRAAEAAGLNPSTAAYTKSKPCVRAYMTEHRAAVSEKLVEVEAGGLRALNLGRDQILARLWQLANLNPEATRGSIAGQIKALSMIVAMEGLIPGGRPAPAQAPPAGPPLKPRISGAEWLPQQRQAEGVTADHAMAAAEPQPVPPQVTEPEPPKAANEALPREPELTPARPMNPFIHPAPLSRLPDATAFAYDTVINTANSLRLPFTPQRLGFKHGRPNR